MWETVDLRELRVFLALAEELHFGRTAERLQLTPSRVSQSIRSLESKLGGQLVHRTSRRVRLTELGERFQGEAAAVYADLMGVLERTHAASQSLGGTLRVGLLSGPTAGPHLLAIIDAFVAGRPDRDVEVNQTVWPDVYAQLRRGEFDVMTVWLPVTQPDLVTGPVLASEPRVLAAAPTHPLAQRTRISIEEVADYDVPHIGRIPTELRDAIVPPVTPSGRPMRQVAVPLSEGGLTDLGFRISRGELVHPTVLAAAPYLGLGIVYIPIVDLPPLRSTLVWRRRSTDPRLREFVRVARELLDV